VIITVSHNNKVRFYLLHPSLRLLLSLAKAKGLRRRIVS